VAERGVESLFGGSKRAGCDCSLVKYPLFAEWLRRNDPLAIEPPTLSEN
jgi:hypothetical protein